MKYKNRLIKIFFVLVLIFAGLVVFNQGKIVSGNSNQTLSSPQFAALFDPANLNLESQQKTSWFQNIIPTAYAAPPFDAVSVTTNPRKLTIYGGVTTVVNSDPGCPTCLPNPIPAVTHALEIGRVYNWNGYANGMGLYSTGSLFLSAKGATRRYDLWLDVNTGNVLAPGQLFLGYGGSGLQGDLHIYRDGVCRSGSCRALTNMNYDYRYCENDPAKAQCNNDYASPCPSGKTCCTATYPDCNQYVQTLTFNYIKDFKGGVETPGQFYIGFTPSYADIMANNGLMVKYTSSNSAIYAENSSGYAGYFAGKVNINSMTSPPTKARGLVATVGGDREPLTPNLSDNTAIRGYLRVVTGSAAQARGAGLMGDVYNSTINNGGPLYGGYFQCGGPNDDTISPNYDYFTRCFAGYFSGPTVVSIPKNYATYSGTPSSAIGLKVHNYYHDEAIGLDIETSTQDITGQYPHVPPYPPTAKLGWDQGPIYGLRIQTGNPTNGASNRINYGLYIKPGWAGQDGCSTANCGYSYGLYVDANPGDSTQFPFTQTVYAGYFKGNVMITGKSVLLGATPGVTTEVARFSFSNNTGDEWTTLDERIYKYRGEIASRGVLCTGGRTLYGEPGSTIAPAIGPPTNTGYNYCCRVNFIDGCNEGDTTCIIGCYDNNVLYTPPYSPCNNTLRINLSETGLNEVYYRYSSTGGTCASGYIIGMARLYY